jgi:hypothetical protein
MITVYLSPSEEAWAHRIGQQRFATVERQKLHARWGNATAEQQIIGAKGELAFCKALGLIWPAYVDTFDAVADVPPNWEVRAQTKSRMLPVKADTKKKAGDPDDRLVAAVFVAPPKYEVIGYIRAGGAKKKVPMTDPGKRKSWAHMIPYDRLVPIDPDFHSFCGYALDDWGLFSCAFCGRPSDSTT